MRWYQKAITSVLTIATLVGTALPAMAAAEPRGPIGEVYDQLTTDLSGPNVGAIIECYSEVEDMGTTIRFGSRYMNTNVGAWASDKEITIPYMKRYVSFYGTVQWVSAKDTFSKTHHY